MFERVGLVGFELEERVAAVFNHQRDALRLAVEGVAGDGGTVQRGARVKSAGTGQFTFFFGFLAHGGLLGDGDHDGPHQERQDRQPTTLVAAALFGLVVTVPPRAPVPGSEALDQVMTEPAMTKQFSDIGYDVILSTPEELQRIIQVDYERWKPVAGAIKIE